jgi:dCTP deaminase
VDEQGAGGYCGIMSVLSKSLLLDRLKLQIDDPRSFVVTPFDESALDADSLDLRLGHHFLFPRLPAEAAVDTRGNDPRSDFSVHIPFDKPLVLPAHQTVLGVTLEFIKLPYDVSGQILTKSSIARSFLVIETAPWIHPNYRGCLTLEIANVSNSALVLHPGMPIGQLILLSVDKPAEIESISGTYVGPIRPEAPPNKVKHKH